MNTPKTILVPIDFSDHSQHAVDYAFALASILDAKVHLFHAVSIPVFGAAEAAMTTASMLPQLVGESERALGEIADARRASGRLGKVLIEVGDPRDLILATCEKVGADLIVMGTHGRRGIRRALLGSVAESIVRTAPCPVMAIRPPSK